MQIVGVGKEISEKLKNINKLLRIGEKIEVKIISKQGKNLYIVQLKGNLFEGLSNKELNGESLKAKVKSLQPKIIVESETGDIVIDLIPLKSNDTELTSKIKHALAKGFIISSDKNKTRLPILKEGETVQIEVTSKKSDGVYYLKIDKSLFEALTKLKIDQLPKLLTFVVEETEPNIVLRLIKDSLNTIEYLEGKERILIDSSITYKNINEITTSIENAIDSEKPETILLNLQNAKDSLNKLVESSVNLKKLLIDMVQTTKSGIYKNEDSNTQIRQNKWAKKVISAQKIGAYTHTDNYSSAKTALDLPSFQDRTKGQILVDLLKKLLHNSFDENALKMKNTNIQNIDKDIERIAPIIVNYIKTPLNTVPTNIKELFGTGFINELIDGLDRIITQSINIRELLDGTKHLVAGNKKTDIRKRLQTIKQLIDNELSNHKNSILMDSDKLVENVKNILKQTSTTVENLNFFVHIPVITKQRRDDLYVKSEKDKKRNDGKKSFKITIMTEMGMLGFVEIQGLYLDGNINCRVGFSKQEQLKKFTENIEKLKKILGPKVNLSTFFIQSTPNISHKTLNIKI